MLRHRLNELVVLLVLPTVNWIAANRLLLMKTRSITPLQDCLKDSLDTEVVYPLREALPLSLRSAPALLAQFLGRALCEGQFISEQEMVLVAEITRRNFVGYEVSPPFS